MKPFYFSLILAFGINLNYSLGQSQPVLEDYRKSYYLNFNLKGKVKSLVESYHEVIDSSGHLVSGKIKQSQFDSPTLIYSYIFDSNGYILKCFSGHFPFDTSSITTYVYNSGLLQEINEVFLGEKRIIATYRYDEKYIRKNSPFDGFYSFYHLYDKKGNLLSSYMMDSVNILRSHMYYYFKKNQLYYQTILR